MYLMYHISNFAIVLAHVLFFYYTRLVTAYWFTFIHNIMVMASIVYLDLCFDPTEVHNVEASYDQ